MTSHEDHIRFIADFISKKGINCVVYKVKGKNAYSFMMNGNAQCLKFFNLIYEKASFLPTFLKRKYFKAKYFLEKYGATLKKKYNIPTTTSSSKMLERAREILEPQVFLFFENDWNRIQARENIIPSATSSQRFLPRKENEEFLKELEK